MASGTDILFGGLDGGSTTSKPAAPASTPDTDMTPTPPAASPPQQSGTDILFAPASPDTTAAKPGDIDPLTGRPYAFATTATTPVATTLNKPIVEGQQPGPVTQAEINIATEAEQRRRIAAAQLFPDLTPKEAQARVFYGDDGRLAAVGQNGQPFYVDPLPVLSGGSGQNRAIASPTTTTTTTPAAPAGAGWAERLQASMPPGGYSSPSYQPPTGSLSPFTPGALTARNLLAAGGSAVPSAATVPAMIAGETVAGPAGLGAASFASDVARQFIANRIDPQAGGNPYDFGTYATNAAINALTGAGAKELTKLAAPNVAVPANLTAAQAEQARIAKVAEDNDIPIFPQQAPGAPRIAGQAANVAQALPLSGVSAGYRKQAENLTGAAIKEMGDTSGAKALTPEVMQNAALRMDQGFKTLLPQMNAPIMANPTALTAIQKTAADAQSNLSNFAPSSLASAKGLIGKVLDTAQANGGVIPGADLQRMVETGGLFDTAMSGGDPYVARVAQQLKGTLIDAARTAPGAAGDAAQKWQELRYQYKVMKALETPAIKNPDNLLTPSSLFQAVRNSFGDTAMARGEAGTMGDLAKIGQMTKQPPTSGTWEHGGLYSAATGLAGGLMALPYSGWGPLIGTLTGLAGATGTGAASRMYFRRNLANQLANPGLYGGSNLVAGGVAPSIADLLRSGQQPNQLAAP